VACDRPSGVAASVASAPLEPPARSVVREVSVRAVAPPPEVARLLVGRAPAGAEARIELGGGPFAGASIHLAVAGGGVEVRVVAGTELARAALGTLIDRVGLHLRARGIVMRTGASSEMGSRNRQRDGRERR
jgi:hypothetical protein